MQNKFLIPNWDVPKNVKSLITYRVFDGKDFNLALHSNHTLSSPEINRLLLTKYLPSTPQWLNQTHSDNTIDLDNEHLDKNTSIDASFTRQIKKVCAIMTADCIPVLITNQEGSFVSAIHAGWRGVHNQIVLKTIIKSQLDPKSLLIYIGPSICKLHFEVGDDVYQLFTEQSSNNKEFFIKQDNDKYLCDLQGILIAQLEQIKVNKIYTSNLCTICNNELFYSYRKEKNTGRFASFIWLE